MIMIMVIPDINDGFDVSVLTTPVTAMMVRMMVFIVLVMTDSVDNSLSVFGGVHNFGDLMIALIVLMIR